MSDWAEVVREGFVRAAKGAGLPQHFIDGIRVEVEDEGFLIYNNWTGYNETRKTQTPLANILHQRHKRPLDISSHCKGVTLEDW